MSHQRAGAALRRAGAALRLAAAGLRLSAWIAGLAASIVVLTRMGDGPLAAPPWRGGRHDLAQWLATRDGATVLMSMVRLAALGTAVYLLSATLLALAARTTRAACLISISDRLTLPVVRRLLGSTLGLAIAVGPLMATDSAWALAPVANSAWALAPVGNSAVALIGDAPGPPVSVVEAPPPGVPEDPPLLRRLPDEEPPRPATPFQATAAPSIAATPATTVTPVTTARSATTATPVTTGTTAITATPSTMVTPSTAASTATTNTPAITATPATGAPPSRPLPNDGVQPEMVPAPATAPGNPLTNDGVQPAMVPAPPAKPPAPDVAPTWIVRPGDHLWLIATETLRTALQRPVSDDEVAPYWERVVSQNRARLPDPANADLLYAGMHVVLPPIR